MVIKEEIEELKTEREVKEKLNYLRGELEKVKLGSKDFYYLSEIIGSLEDKEMFLEESEDCYMEDNYYEKKYYGCENNLGFFG